MDFFQLMRDSAAEAGIELTEEQYNKFIKYKELVLEWNQKINLTAITEDSEFITKHFIDCIKIFKSNEIKNANSIIDVGTGAGFPGIPIAILAPEKKVCLLDSLNKRINFLDTVVSDLNLKNVRTVHSRAEDGARNSEFRENFDVAVSRAVANMTVLSEFCLPYVKVKGSFVALKGPAIEDEISESKNAIKKLGGEIKNIIEVDIEGTDLHHNIVIVDKVKECPKQYPRKAGTVSKKPLK